MNDTAFYLTEQQASEWAKSYKKNSGWQAGGGASFTSERKSPHRATRYPAANGGFFPPPGLLRFCKMLLTTAS